MKKILLPFIILVVVLQDTNAQQRSINPPFSIGGSMETVDSGNIRVLYAFNAVDIKEQSSYDDLHRLDIGSQLSKYYSYFVHNSDSLRRDWKKRNERAESSPGWIGPFGKSEEWTEYKYSEYFKDFSKNLFTEYARMPWGLEKNNCYYSENIPVQNWKLRNDTLTIAGYLCQKAICRFGGRDYIAWFTPDIPVSNGPWKFGNLPGLILKVYDKNKLNVFECIGIENHGKKYPVTRYIYKSFLNTDRKKLLNLQKSIHDDYWSAAGIKLRPDLKIINKPSLPPKYRIVYHPLELE